MKDGDWPQLTDRDKQAIDAIREQLDRDLGQWSGAGDAQGSLRRTSLRTRLERPHAEPDGVPVVVQATPRPDRTLLRVGFGAGAATLVAGAVLALFPSPEIPTYRAPAPPARPAEAPRPDRDAAATSPVPGIGPISSASGAAEDASAPPRYAPAPTAARRQRAVEPAIASSDGRLARPAVGRSRPADDWRPPFEASRRPADKSRRSGGAAHAPRIAAAPSVVHLPSPIQSP